MNIAPDLFLKFTVRTGTSIEEAAAQLCTMANTLDVICEAELNGVTLWVKPGQTPERAVAIYYRTLEIR